MGDDRTVEHLSGYPLMISAMVAASLEEVRCRGLEYVLAEAAGPWEGVIEAPVRPHPSMRSRFLRALRSEAQGNLQGLTIIASSHDAFAKGSGQMASRGPGLLGATLATRFWRVFFLPSELHAARDIIAYHMSRPAESYAEARKNLQAIREAAEAGEMGILTAIAHPDYFSFIVRPMMGDLHRGMGDLALAVAAYRAERSAYPSRPEDLVPDYITEIPTDPFANAPIRMQAVEGGLALCSDGPQPGDSPPGSRYRGSVYFYVGQAAYREHRVRPAQDERTGGNEAGK